MSTGQNADIPEPVRIRRVVSIAGRVADAVTEVAIAGAVVEIKAGPEKFQSRVDLLKSLPAQDQKIQRLIRSVSGTDGSYFLVDLEEGNYTLSVDAPHLGARYQGEEDITVKVPAPIEGKPVKTAWQELSLKPTGVEGKVLKNSGEGPKPQAVERVRLRLLDKKNVMLSEALTDEKGDFRFLPVPAADNYTLTIIPPLGYEPSRQEILNLRAGEFRKLDDIQLQPKTA